MGNGFASQPAPLHQVQLLDHRGVEIIQLLSPCPFQRVPRHRQGLDGREHFRLKTVAVPHILLRRLAFALLLVGATRTGQTRQANHLPFEPAPPIPALAPAGQLGGLGHRHQQVRAFALGVPQQVHVRRKMDVCLQHISVGLGADRFSRSVFFFFEHCTPSLHHHRVNLLQQFLVHVTDVFRESLVVERLFLVPQHRVEPQDLSQQTVVVGQMLQPVVVTIQGQTHDP